MMLGLSLAARKAQPAAEKKMYAEAQLRLLRDLPAVPVRKQNYVFARQPYIDLGYEPKSTMIYGYHLTEKTSILKH